MDTVPFNGEMSRLVTAAVVNKKFCDLLLTSPAAALAAGYNGESFYLTPRLVSDRFRNTVDWKRA
jgi:hypothetical protein